MFPERETRRSDTIIIFKQNKRLANHRERIQNRRLLVIALSIDETGRYPKRKSERGTWNFRERELAMAGFRRVRRRERAGVDVLGGGQNVQNLELAQLRVLVLDSRRQNHGNQNQPRHNAADIFAAGELHPAENSERDERQDSEGDTALAVAQEEARVHRAFQ